MDSAQSAAATTPDTVQVSTTGLIQSWVDTPMSIAIVFAFATAVLLGIYFLRRGRARQQQ